MCFQYEEKLEDFKTDLLDDNEVTEIIAGKKSKNHHKSAVGNTEKKTELI